MKNTNIPIPAAGGEGAKSKKFVLGLDKSDDSDEQDQAEGYMSSKALLADGPKQASDTLNLNIITSLMTKQFSKEQVDLKSRHSRDESGERSCSGGSPANDGGHSKLLNLTQVSQMLKPNSNKIQHATESPQLGSGTRL